MIPQPHNELHVEGFFPADSKLAVEELQNYVCNMIGCPVDMLVTQYFEAVHQAITGTAYCKIKVRGLLAPAMMHAVIKIYMTIGCLPDFHSAIKKE